MGMNFSPMYQPVSTKTIKADGDLNIDPYDLIAVDGKFDTVEADEFVGGVGNFSGLVLQGGLNLSYSEFVDYTTGGFTSTYILPIVSSPFPLNGVISVKATVNTTSNLRCVLYILESSGNKLINLTNTQTEYTVSNALFVGVIVNTEQNVPYYPTITYGIPVIS